MTSIEVADLLKMIPVEQLSKLAEQTQVDWNVSHLRGSVMFDLLLLGMIRSDRLSTHVLEELYNSSMFEAFSSKNPGHQTRHSSLADRLSKISPAYFQAIFEWSCQHFQNQLSQNKWSEKIYRFDSTLIRISSALVKWGMQVGRPPDEGPPKVQLKVTLGLKGLLPASVQTYFDQANLSEENALFSAIKQAGVSSKDYLVFDRGLKSRRRFKDFDEQGINFVTRGFDKLRFKHVDIYRPITEAHNQNQLRLIQDSRVYLYSNKDRLLEHPFRLVEVVGDESGKSLFFITNIWDLDARQIAEIYRYRWDIEVFFRFLKQELNIKHLLSHSENGVRVQVFVTLTMAILLTVFKTRNKISSYKKAKIRFEDQLLLHIVNELHQLKRLIIEKNQGFT